MSSKRQLIWGNYSWNWTRPHTKTTHPKRQYNISFFFPWIIKALKLGLSINLLFSQLIDRSTISCPCVITRLIINFYELCFYILLLIWKIQLSNIKISILKYLKYDEFFSPNFLRNRVLLYFAKFYVYLEFEVKILIHPVYLV